MHTRLVIAHHSALVRGVIGHLGVDQGVVVVGETDTMDGLVDLCAGERPGVVVVESALRDAKVDGILTELVATGAKVLVVCDDPDPEHLTRILAMGASGFLRRDVTATALVEAVTALARGEVVLDPVAAGTILEQWRRLRQAGASPTLATVAAELTARETEVLGAMADGLATKAIARRLGMALKTVENHKTRIFDKLGVRSQAAAVAFAIGHGILATTTAAG